MQYLFSLLIAFLGLPSGLIVGWMAKEELKDGKKYFLFTMHVIAGGIVFFLLSYYLRNPYLSGIIGLIAATVSWYFRKEILNLEVLEKKRENNHFTH